MDRAVAQVDRSFQRHGVGASRELGKANAYTIRKERCDAIPVLPSAPPAMNEDNVQKLCRIGNRTGAHQLGLLLNQSVKPLLQLSEVFDVKTGVDDDLGLHVVGGGIVLGGQFGRDQPGFECP